ncbi:restriction endonuclease [Streptomyces sp. RPA4-5]|nr:restriction endonuclease [Streptomyces sp. RPA4-5]
MNLLPHGFRFIACPARAALVGPYETGHRHRRTRRGWRTRRCRIIRHRHRSRPVRRGAETTDAQTSPAAPELSVQSEEPAAEDVYLADDADVGPEEFEQLVALLAERDGCLEVRVVGGANDLGADVLAVTPDAPWQAGS